MKVYIVLWSDTFEDWDIKKVFSTEEKAREYINSRVTGKNSLWIEEKEVE